MWQKGTPMLILGHWCYFYFAIVHFIITQDPDAKKGNTDAKKWPCGFIYVDRAQTEQQLNLVHDRGIYFTSRRPRVPPTRAETEVAVLSVIKEVWVSICFYHKINRYSHREFLTWNFCCLCHKIMLLKIKLQNQKMCNLW